MEFKDLIRLRRVQLDKTLEAIGKEVGVSKATVQRWESGEIKNIRRDKIAKLAAALQVSPDYILGCEEAPSLKLTEGVSRDDIKFALFGDVSKEITDEEYEDVMRYAQFIKEKKKKK